MRKVLAAFVLIAAMANSAADGRHTGTRMGKEATADDGFAAIDIMAESLAELRPAKSHAWLEQIGLRRIALRNIVQKPVYHLLDSSKIAEGG